jgi:thymidylate synthase ThyX
MIEATIIADSVNKYGSRLTTFVCTYPRFILAEINTHRALSKNTASSRAIPVERTIEQVLTNPAMPIEWGKNQKGMCANEQISEEDTRRSKFAWIAASYDMVDVAKHLLALNLHKQIVNRLLEPFIWTTSIISGTDWANFFALRTSEEAQPEFRDLATKMLKQYKMSSPKWKADGGWHIPFGDKYCDKLNEEQRIKVATARCARVSYNTFDGEIDFDKDYALHDKLLRSGHMSPTEHCAYAIEPESQPASNFTGGWYQYRKTFTNENIREMPNV